jgi:hypothetical protein
MGGQLRPTSACSLSTLATRWPTVHASPACNGSGLSSVVDHDPETTSGHDRASYGDDDLAAAVALHQISNPWATSLSGKVLSMTGVTLPASMSSPKTSRFCSLSAPVGQLECPAQPGGLHAAIARDGTPRAVNCRSARGRSWHSRIAAMESGCLSLLTICTVHITYAGRKETVQSER